MKLSFIKNNCPRACELSLLVVLAFVMGGCGLFKTELDKCYEKREYQDAAPGARLRVPEDLNGLAEDAWVPIPYGETNAEPTPQGDQCLIEPPDYRVGN